MLLLPPFTDEKTKAQTSLNLPKTAPLAEPGFEPPYAAAPLRKSENGMEVTCEEEAELNKVKGLINIGK